MLTFSKSKLLIALLYCLPIEGRSLIEETPYPAFCQQAADHEAAFAHFKREAIYQAVSETVKYQTGAEYLDLILLKDPNFASLFDKFRENDSIGDPITYNYGNYGWFSPTTLRYIKIACELKQKFGDLSQMHIVEIGGGYGGLCKILHDLGGFASYTIIDLPECNALAKKHLALLGIENVHFIDNNNLAQAQPYDLVISNYIFSQFDRMGQQAFIERVIKDTPNGYLTMNFISQHLQSLSIEEMIRVLYQNKKTGVVEKEHPNTHADNVLITWKQGSSLQTLKERNIPRPTTGFQSGNGITYSLSGGRLGDNLLAYLHARWFAFKYNIPLYYIPFPYSDQFLLSELDQPLNSAFHFKNTIHIASDSNELAVPNSSLFILPYYAEYRFEYDRTRFYWLPFFQIDWQDPAFRAEVKRCLTPKAPIATINLPKDRITVGVHIRKGGGFDGANSFKRYPLKFPFDNYYIQQIKRIAQIFHDKPLYIYILTDDFDPARLARRYAIAINNRNIHFGYRKGNNGPTINVLEDFFLIPKFDCLVISQSNFSVVASKLADYAVTITPLHATFVGDRPVIDEVEFCFNGNYAIGTKN